MFSKIAHQTAKKTAIIAVATFLALATVLGGSLACIEKAQAASDNQELKVLFTHDIHSNLDTTVGYVGDVVREYAGAARLSTLLQQEATPSSVYLDAGDFSMGTLYQAGYSTGAYELRMLGLLGCQVTTFGNHEWDQGGTGLAKMLRAAIASGDPLPQIVISNLDFSGELTAEQADVKAAFEEYGVKNYTILNVNGLRVGVFGVSGEDSIECAPTSGMKWLNYIEAAKSTVAEIGDQADIVVCLSHSGTKGDGKTGEDFDLAKEVSGIDIIVSGHSHSAYEEPIESNGTLIVSSGEYLNNLGSITLSVSGDAKTCTDYKLIPIDGTVAEDSSISAVLNIFKESIQNDYLATYAPGATIDEVIARSDFDFMSLQEMYKTHQEYPLGDLIADSYQYAAKKNGIDDVDVALVGLGTIRGSIAKGNITTADAFYICSLGVGADGSTGHPIVAAYITGKELKLLTELDASLGEFVNSIKMSYSGLSYTFNTARMLLDRVTEVHLVRPDGTTEEIDDEKLYKVSCNMYAANMLGMLNGLTKGALAITPKYADGTPIEDFYTCSMLDSNGNEIKEWVAFRDYLMSFEKTDGVSTIPSDYATAQGRKIKVTEHGLGVIANPGATTIAVIVFVLVIVAIVALIVWRVRVRRKRKRERAQ